MKETGVDEKPETRQAPKRGTRQETVVCRCVVCERDRQSK